MAVKKQKQKENIRKKTVTKDYLLPIKAMTKYLTNKKRSDYQLDDIIEKFKIENTICKRLISYTYGFPYICWYFNRYLNSKYEFDSFDTKTLIKSIIYLMSINNRCEYKLFTFIKSNDLKDDVKDTIKTLIKSYLELTYDIYCNRRDLNFYYKLFLCGAIPDQDLLEVDRLLNGDKPLIKSLSVLNFKDAIAIGEETCDEEVEINSGENEISVSSTERPTIKAQNIPAQEQEDKDLLLVDVKKVGNDILMIYTDKNGIKKYIKKDFKFPILIKNKKWDKCEMITDKIDDTCIANDYERSVINKKCKEMMGKIINI